MKCDLCKREKTGGSLLCEPCSEMIGRLLTIRERLEGTEAAEVVESFETEGNAAKASR